MLKKKICMVGRFGVGKSSLVRRFVDSVFDERYLATLGVKIDTKEVAAASRTVALAIWDIAGEDDLAQVRSSHLRGAAGYLLVADGCRKASFAKALELQNRIEGQFGSLPSLLLVNKADLRDQWEIASGDLEAYTARGYLWRETSAKSGDGVEAAFQLIAEKLLDASSDEDEE